jgi:hypothetical protein
LAPNAASEARSRVSDADPVMLGKKAPCSARTFSRASRSVA